MSFGLQAPKERLYEDVVGNCSKFPPGGGRLPLLVLLGFSGMLLRGTNAGVAHFLTKMTPLCCVNTSFAPCGLRECLGELVEMRMVFLFFWGFLFVGLVFGFFALG